MNFPLFFSFFLSYCLVVDAEMILASLRGEGPLDCSSVIVLGSRSGEVSFTSNWPNVNH